MIKLFDKKVDIEIRLFMILGWTALIANSVGFLSNLVFYGMAADTIFYGVCAIIMFLLGIFARRSGREKMAASLILLIVNLIEFPVMYYLYGSGRIVYMVLGGLGIIVFAKKERRVLLAVLAMCLDIIVMVLSVIHPSHYVESTPKSDLGAAITSFVIVMVSLILIIILIIHQYEMQNQELRDMTEELKSMAIRDPLTLLYNRRYLTEYLEERMSQNDSSFSVALLDLDNFKSVNDRYGHLYGDEVLQNFAKIIKGTVEKQGIAARFGGEEFMLVLHTIEEEEIGVLMEKARREFAEFSMATKGIRLTFSGGVEIYHKSDRITRLFNAADEKLYLAKEQGKNKVIYKAKRGE